MKIDLDRLTKTELGKFNRLLEKRYLFNNEIKTLKELIASGEFTGKSIENKEAEFNRSYFNRLNGNQQTKYEESLKTRSSYLLKCKSGGYLEVPKIVFKAITFINSVNIGGLEITNVDQNGIIKLACDNLNDHIKELWEGNIDGHKLSALLLSTNLEELKRAGVLTQLGNNTEPIIENAGKLFDFITNCLENEILPKFIF
jgi:hypothetical protein